MTAVGNYIPTTAAQQREMLAAIGVGAIGDLFADIPAAVRFRGRLDLPPALAEAELIAHLRELSGRNSDCDRYPCFMGGGAYDRLVPAALGAIVSRSEFYTAYTPYQAEISQGVLQAIYEYQTALAELTGMAVANASMYDGATALAEACLVACAATGRSRVVVPVAVHPEYRGVAATYLRHQGLQLVTVPYRNGVTDPDELAGAVDADTAAVVVQQPNFFGNLEDTAAIGQAAKAAGALFIACVEPVSLGVLKPPGQYGADIAVGEGQPLGNALSFGGPYLGFFAAREDLVRRIPGRIAGATVDGAGRRGYVLTLQAREQHIRRERASSNICTNQALNALTALVYLCLLGREGLREAAELSFQKAHYLRRRLTALPGFAAAWEAPFFQEFVVQVPGQPDEINRHLLKRGIIGGIPLGRHYPELASGMLLCVTEARTRAQIDALVAALQEVAAAVEGGRRP